MATRRVNGLIYVTCPYCRTKFGPYQRLGLGQRSCGRCGRSFNVR
jgi:hypothetical protein